MKYGCRVNLVVQVKIQQVPVIDEPEESHAAERKKRVPDFIPNPLLVITPGPQAVVNRHQGTQARQQSDNLQQVQPRIAPLGQGGWIVKLSHKNQYTHRIDDNTKAH